MCIRDRTGRVHTLICRGSAEELEQQLAALHPIFIDAVPLSLDVYKRQSLYRANAPSSHFPTQKRSKMRATMSSRAVRPVSLSLIHI